MVGDYHTPIHIHLCLEMFAGGGGGGSGDFCGVYYVGYRTGWNGLIEL